ncbi:hypothetical protein KIPB_010952, partial [Kipferlia bialata]
VTVSPHLYWLFRSMGHLSVSIIDGGLPEWERLFETESGPALPCQPCSLLDFSPLPLGPSMVVTSIDYMRYLAELEAERERERQAAAEAEERAREEQRLLDPDSVPPSPTPSKDTPKVEAEPVWVGRISPSASCVSSPRGGAKSLGGSPMAADPETDGECRIHQIVDTRCRDVSTPASLDAASLPVREAFCIPYTDIVHSEAERERVWLGQTDRQRILADRERRRDRYAYTPADGMMKDRKTLVHMFKDAGVDTSKPCTFVGDGRTAAAVLCAYCVVSGIDCEAMTLYTGNVKDITHISGTLL